MAWRNECSVEDLLGGFIADAAPAVRGVRVTGVATDSRRVVGGELFIAVMGDAVDGHDFARAALERGARAIAVERDIGLPEDAPVVRVTSGRRSVARAADRFFGSPSRDLFLVGATGTNGKTTVSYLARAVLEAAGRTTALIGTIEYALPGAARPATHTTPDALEVQRMLREAVDAGADAAVMEVSSHGLVQERVAEVSFDVALFTNLSHDHLDYHGTMERYREAKAGFFRADLAYGESRTAVLNLDDATGAAIARETSLPVVGYAVDEPSADVRATVRAAHLDGLDLTLAIRGETRDVHLAMPGRVNASNAAAAAAAGWVAGIGIDTIAAGLASVRGVPGRSEAVRAGQPFGVIVDFAHTPDALERLLQGLRAVTPGRLVIVFGCGGDRDAAKRPVMGAIAGRLADRVIVTSDNPRSEDPARIAADITAGVTGRAGVETELDRAAAIRRAIVDARPGDLVVIAGKGHERTQVIGAERRPFDDAAVAREALHGLGHTRD